MGFFDKGKYKSGSAESKPEPVITEMCDVCGKDWPTPIPRFQCTDKWGTVFVIRCCPNCDPRLGLKRIGIDV